MNVAVAPDPPVLAGRSLAMYQDSCTSEILRTLANVVRRQCLSGNEMQFEAYYARDFEYIEKLLHENDKTCRRDHSACLPQPLELKRDIMEMKEEMHEEMKTLRGVQKSMHVMSFKLETIHSFRVVIYHRYKTYIFATRFIDD